MPTNQPVRRDLLKAAIGGAAILPVTLTTGDVAAAIRGSGLSALDFGARFDGRADDASALQRGIDEAARQQRPLVLPSGVARLGAPLNVNGRYIALLGDPSGATVLRAAGPLRCLIDARETSEVIDSPLFLYGLTLDGAGVASAGLLLRYRHRTVLDTIAVGGCETGIDEEDSWLGRRVNCRTRGTQTGWRLRGANHSSVWIGCSFTDAQIAHLDIGSHGTAHDGNDALLFQACDIEFGKGHGVLVAAGANATFDTCYLGESIAGDVIRNAGRVTLRGGALFVGDRADSVGIKAQGGVVTVTGTALRGQRFGTLDRLAAGAGGTITFDGVDTQLKVGGNPCLTGNVLGTAPMRVLAPVIGRAWQATTSGAAITSTSARDERRVRCDRPTGANPVIGLAALLRDVAEARRDGPAYFVIVYTATRPVELKVTAGPVSQAPWRFIGTLPSTKGLATYIKADVPVEFNRYTHVELVMYGGPGDELTLFHATVGDGSTLAPGAMANLARAR